MRCGITSSRATLRMSRKLRKNGIRLFVSLYCGEYWIYEPHPVYEFFGHKRIENIGKSKRLAWDRVSEIARSGGV